MAQEIYAFLHLEGVDGEAEDADFKKHLALQSVAWGATNGSTFSQGTGPTSQNKGQLHDITFSKYLCAGSLRLLERALTGEPIKKGTLSLVKMVGTTKMVYFKVVLENVSVNQVHISANGGILPMESCTISYVIARPEYKPQSNTGDAASGKVHWGWNCQENKSC